MRIFFLFLLLSCCAEAQVRVTTLQNSRQPWPDIYPPTVVVSSVASIDTSGVFTVTFTTSETALGFTTADITYSSSTVSIGTLGTTDPLKKVWTLTGTSTLVNGCSFSVGAGAFTDPAGNANLASNNLSVRLGIPDWKTYSPLTDYMPWRLKWSQMTTQTAAVTLYNGGTTITHGESLVNGPNGLAYWINGGKTTDPTTNTLGTFTNNGTVFDGALAPNGKIYQPGDVTNLIDIIDTSNGAHYQMAVGALPQVGSCSPNKYYWGACMAFVNGQPVIICAPACSGSILVIKPTSLPGVNSGDSFYFIGTGNSKLQPVGPGGGYSQATEVIGQRVVFAPNTQLEIPVIDLTVFDGSGNLTDASISFPFGTISLGGWESACNGLDYRTYMAQSGPAAKVMQLDWTAMTATIFTNTPSPALSGRCFRGMTMDLRGHLIGGGPLGESRFLDILPGTTPTVNYITPAGNPWAGSYDPKEVCVIMMSDGRVAAVSYDIWNSGVCSWAAYGVSQGTFDPNFYCNRFVNHP